MKAKSILLRVFTLLLISFFMTVPPHAQSIVNFDNQKDLNKWYIVNDGVMGGLSKGYLKLTDGGYALFSGYVSLDNNGGFTSIRYDMKLIEFDNKSKFVIKVKGDGKDYQFRVKSDSNQRYSYIKTFSTTGEWQTIEIAFNDMYPSFRGRILDLPNYDGDTAAEITFLIGNKREENFDLLIAEVVVE